MRVTSGTALLRPFLQGAFIAQKGYRENAKMSVIREACRLQLSEDERTALEDILRIRRLLAEDRGLLLPVDYGAGSTLGNRGSRSIGSIHEVAAIPNAWGVFLFRLVRLCGAKNVLELGTSLGVSGSYLKRALLLNQGDGRLVTLEGDPTLCAIASSHLDSLGGTPATVIEGPFKETLPIAASELAPIDFVFVDGHHETEASLSYFSTVLDFVSEEAILVFDDIEPVRGGVSKAWKTIRRHERTRAAFHLMKLGVAVVGPPTA